MKKFYVWFATLTMVVVIFTGCTQAPKKNEEGKFKNNDFYIEIQDNRIRKYTLSSTDLFYRFYESAQESGILVYSWEHPSEIRAELLSGFFSHQSNWNQVADDSVIVYVPQEIIENYLKAYFDIESTQLRQSTWYRPEQESYELALYPHGEPSIITKATTEGNRLTIYYETYTPYIEGFPVLSQGHVTIEIDKYPTHWKFISNEITYQGERTKEKK